MVNAKQVILDVAKEYERLTGRSYGFFETYRLDDAEMAIVVLSSAAGTTRFVVDQLRKQGMKVGMLKLRVFRPFPATELVEALKHVGAIAIMDRADSLSGEGGPVGAELRAAFYNEEKRPKAVNYIYGLGGRDVTIHHIESVYKDLANILETGVVGPTVRHLGVRE